MSKEEWLEKYNASLSVLGLIHNAYYFKFQGVVLLPEDEIKTKWIERLLAIKESMNQYVDNCIKELQEVENDETNQLV
jgi:hypothetical protein